MSAEERMHPANAWAPQSGPQVTFAQTEADFAIIGGSPGGGKTVVCLYEAAKLCMLPGARRVRATAFRRDEVSLLKSGSVWDRATEMLPAFGATIRNDDKSATFEHPDGQIEDQHRIDFRHLHRIGDERTYDGSEQDLIIFEEIQEFEASQVFYMWSRARSRSGLRPRLRGSCNADPDCVWLVEMLISGGWVSAVDGYAIPAMSGVVRWLARDEQTDELLWYDTREQLLAAHPELEPEDALSFTFVLSLVKDNPALLRKDPGYRGRLRVQLRKDRVRLIGDGEGDKGGCWFSADTDGDFFARDAIKLLATPPSPLVRRVRAWDFGSSAPSTDERDPDRSEGALLGLCEGGELWIEDFERRQLGPVATTEAVIEIAKRDGPLVEIVIFQDGGAAGKRDALTTQAALEKERFVVHVVHSDRRQGDEKGEERETSITKKRRPTKRARSSPAKQALCRPWALLAKAGRVYALAGAPWLKDLVYQTHKFPNARKDDMVDAISGGAHVLTDGGLSVTDALEQRERALQREQRVEPTPRRRQHDDIEIIDLDLEDR